MNPEIINLKNRPDLKEKAIKWFSSKWGVAEIEYRKSFDEMYADISPIPLWFVILGDDGEIAAGCGIIENDFVDRTDLKPYLCALFVEPQYRGMLGAESCSLTQEKRQKRADLKIYIFAPTTKATTKNTAGNTLPLAITLGANPQGYIRQIQI